MKIKNLISTFIFLIIMFIFYSITVEYYNYKKFYNSYEDKKLAERIEKRLEKIASEVKNTKKSLVVNINELVKNEKVDKICIIGPYSPDMKKLVGINWIQADAWNKSIVSDDSLFSILFVQNNNKIIPVSINLMKLRPEKQTCLENKNIVFNIYNKNNKVFVQINNKK
jgi:hypothetical protein